MTPFASMGPSTGPTLLERLRDLDPVASYELDALLADVGANELRPHVEYRTDPIAWAVERLGIPEHTIRWSLCEGYQGHQWDGDQDPLVQIATALRDWKNVGCESGTGTGKSFWMAVLILWFLACHEDARVFTFAPKEDQLRLYIWMEIGRLWTRFVSLFPTAKLTDLTLRMRGGGDDSWGARGYAVGIAAGEQVSTKAAGMHAEHLLLVYEETPGIPMPVLEAGRNTCTAPHNLRVAIGNPNHQLDSLHRFCTSANTVHVRMSALDHPNVVAENPSLVPGAVSRQKIEERRVEYGDTSPLYLSRVRGISPEQAANALIRVEWLRAAHLRYDARRMAGTLPTVVTGKGVDASNSEHGDRAAIVDFADNVCVRIDAFACPDSNKLGAQAVHEAKLHGLQGTHIGIDAVGVGAGSVNEARRLGVSVKAIYNGAKPQTTAQRLPDGRIVEWGPDVNRFLNFRAQSYWQAREDLRLGVIDVPWDQELVEELTAVTFEDESKVVKLPPKSDIQAVLGRSPDKADAFVMANWVRARKLVPAIPETPKGVSPGYDYEQRKPRERVGANEILAQWIQTRNEASDPLAGRYD